MTLHHIDKKSNNNIAHSHIMSRMEQWNNLRRFGTIFPRPPLYFSERKNRLEHIASNSVAETQSQPIEHISMKTPVKFNAWSYAMRAISSILFHFGYLSSSPTHVLFFSASRLLKIQDSSAPRSRLKH